jgi:microcin C transport system substrate-binding protein
LSTLLYADPQHGFATFNAFKHPKDFTHYDFVNPDAPKGGELTLGALGSYDSFHPFIITGVAAAGLGRTHATLLDQNWDEIASSYGYVAESLDVAPDFTWVIFHLNPKACFDNGQKITVDDVIFSFNTLREKGSPMYRTYYKAVTRVERQGENSIKFHLDGNTSRELPLILGQLPILSKVFFDTHDFTKPLTLPAPSSGPYKVKSFELGRSVVYERIKNWWGENVPSQKGQHNFDVISIDYYRDVNALFEAFKAGKITYRDENIAKFWVTGYTFPAVTSGRVKKDSVPHTIPEVRGIIFNLRKQKFADWRVRKALSDLFDFTWANKNLFYSQYMRYESYFPKSKLMHAKGVPTGRERDILIEYKAHLPADLFTQDITFPSHENETETRTIRQSAMKLFNEAGWHLVESKLIHDQTHEPLTIDLLITDPGLEKIALHLQKCFSPVGVHLNVRLLDVSSYQERVDQFDYDMVFMAVGQSLTPGNEQRSYWGTVSADQKGSPNLPGIKNHAVDALIEKVIQSATYDDIVAYTQALDRVLLWQYALIPMWGPQQSHLAYWDVFGRPARNPTYYPIGYTASWWAVPTQAVQP